MSNVLQFRRKKTETQRSDNDSVIATLGELESRGELRGMINISATAEGTHMDITGAYADRLQFSLFSLINAVHEVTQRIADSGDYGHCKAAGKVSALFKRRRKSIPKRLVESTGFGDLGT